MARKALRPPDVSRRLINAPDDAVVEMLEGLVAAHAHLRRLDGFPHVRRGSPSVRSGCMHGVYEHCEVMAAYRTDSCKVTPYRAIPKTLLLLQAVLLMQLDHDWSCNKIFPLSTLWLLQVKVILMDKQDSSKVSVISGEAYMCV